MSEAQTGSYYLEPQKPSILKRIFSKIFTLSFNFVQAIVILAAILMILYLFILSPHIVDGSSMEPNFCNGDIYFTYKFLPEYKVGDVIAFRKDDSNNLIKRIVGIGGDRIKVENGSVYRNGEKLDETYLPKGRTTSILISGVGLQEGIEYTVPTGKYFVLGDNRPRSNDSRSFLAIDPVKNSIDGKVVLILLNPARMRIFDNNQVYPEDECSK